MKRVLLIKKGVFALLLALSLGMGTAYAYDFSKTCSTGQTLYYNITDATNHYVEITYPATDWEDEPWEGYTKPTGNITLPSSVSYNGTTYVVKAIGWAAFYNCSGLIGSLTIPNSVTTIGNYAFAYCGGFTGSLTIPNSVTTIDIYAFYECSGFTGSLTIGNSVTYIGWAAFYGCSGFTGSLTIGNSVTTIGESAFEGCSGFTGSLTIPNSVTTIGEYAFYECSGFTGSLTIGNSVTTINNLAFYGCSGFTGTLSLGSSLTSISYGAFYGCSGFSGSLTIPNSVTSIGEYAFMHCTGFTGSLTIGNSVTSIGEYAFMYCSGFTGSLTIGNSVTSIGYAAFEECDGFTGSLTIPNSVTTIGDHAFAYCSGFTGSLTFGGSLTSIGNSAFLDCYGLTGSLSIPYSVTTIGNYAFAYCNGFNGSLTIGNSVTSIGQDAFTYCTGLSSMIVLPDTPPTLGTDAFNYVPTDIPVYVPCSALEDYQSASGWNAFTNMQCFETLTVHDGTATNNRIPAYIYFFDDFARSQFVIPAADLAEMTGRPISSMTFYTTTQNVPYTTVSDADVYLMEVDYTTIDAYEPKASATIVYSGRFNIVSADGGGEMTIHFSTPYVYQGGNLLVGIDNTEDIGYMSIYFKGQTVSGASISGSNSSSTGTIPATQQNFIPKTSFVYAPSMCAPKTLPYTYGFEEEDEFDCWTMLHCNSYTGRYSTSLFPAHQDDYGFRFRYNTNPPQYLISPELEGTTGVDVSFYYRNFSNEYPETFQVGYSTTTQSPTAFTWGDEVTAQDADNWILYEDFFPVGTKYVAVKYNSYDQWMLFLDDFSFTPAFCPPEDQCELTFTLTDSYGDGWNGAALDVYDEATGIWLASLSAPNHGLISTPTTDTYTLAVCDGRELVFWWESGSWDGECSYIVTDVNGNEVFSGTGAMSEPFNYIVDCPQQYIFLTDGNWNDGSHWNTGTVPPAGSDVIIQANVTVPAGYLAVANAVSLDGGSITVADGGQLKHNTLDLMVTMKKNIAGYDDANSQNNYYLLAVPFLSVQVPTAMTANPGSDFYRFDPSETGAEWRNHKEEPITFVQRRYGYLYANPESVELSLTGITLSVSNEFTMNYTVDYTEGSSNPSNGWALLGNPFTYNAYVYRFDSNNEFVPMPIMMYDEEGELQTIYGGPVAPMQGFFVHVTETTTVYFSGTAHLNDYVDLGLPSGLLWATCNVGANVPEEYGDYFAWGETTPKDTYTEENYTYSENPAILPSNHDAATANWGGGWRMPTDEEWQELYNNTTITLTTQNGVSGRLFTAANGNSLFLPAAGYRDGGSLDRTGGYGLFWSGSLYTDNPSSAWFFYFISNDFGMNGDHRYYGQSVRPVRSSGQN